MPNVCERTLYSEQYFVLEERLDLYSSEGDDARIFFALERRVVAMMQKKKKKRGELPMRSGWNVRIAPNVPHMY